MAGIITTGVFGRFRPGSKHKKRSDFDRARHLSQADLEKEYQDLAKEVWEFIWKVLNTDTGWRHETGTDLQTGMVYSQNFSECGKLFKLEGEVEISQETLFHELVTNISQLPKWNPTVLECRTIQAIDDTTDVAYQVAAEAAGGIVSSRDFVTLRHWGQREGIIISCGRHVGHPDMPPNKKYVRGENGPGAWVFAPVKNHPERCHFIWLLNTNLKLPGGWVAQSLADRALSGVLLDYLKYVKKRAEVLKQG